jgi:hypothetical protein
MKKYTEQRLIKSIRERIRSEYRKHKGLEWDLIATIKIIRMLKEQEFIIEKEINEI